MLVVEDEPQMRKFVRIALESHDYRVVEAQSGAEALRQASAYTPDAVLLDLGLPDMDGLAVAKRLREWTTVPVLVDLRPRSGGQKVQALDGGADDYLTKPFGAAELLARLRVALRHAARSHEAPNALVQIGRGRGGRSPQAPGPCARGRGAPHAHRVQAAHGARQARRAWSMTHRQLLEQVWGPGHAHQMQYLRVYMTQLRHKLEQHPARPRYLVTEPGIGYRLKTDGE